MTSFIRWWSKYLRFTIHTDILYVSPLPLISPVERKGNYFRAIRGKATTFPQIVYNIHWFSSAVCRLLKEDQGLFSYLFSKDCYNSLEVVLNIKWKCLAPDILSKTQIVCLYVPNSRDHILCSKWVTITFDTERNHSSESAVQKVDSYWG